MRCEIPTPRRCCFCIPLRIGLLVAGYIKIILSTLYMINSFMNLYVSYEHLEFAEHYVIIMTMLYSFFNSVVDVVFHIIFLIAAHKKDYRKIRWYYRYSIYNIIAITVLFLINVGLYLNIFILFFLLKYVIFVALIFLWILVIQIYLLILVRSEFLKLKSNTQFQFVNNEADAECSATIKMSSEVDEVDEVDVHIDEKDYDQISVFPILSRAETDTPKTHFFYNSSRMDE